MLIFKKSGETTESQTMEIIKRLKEGLIEMTEALIEEIKKQCNFYIRLIDTDRKKSQGKFLIGVKLECSNPVEFHAYIDNRLYIELICR